MSFLGFGHLLLADSQLADHVAVAVRIVGLQVIQQAAALADEHQETTARGMIFFVCLEMLGQLANPFTQNRDLDLRGSRIGLVGAEAVNQVSFLSSRQHGVWYAYCVISPLSSVWIETNRYGRGLRRDEVGG